MFYYKSLRLSNLRLPDEHLYADMRKVSRAACVDTCAAPSITVFMRVHTAQAHRKMVSIHGVLRKTIAKKKAETWSNGTVRATHR